MRFRATPPSRLRDDLEWLRSARYQSLTANEVAAIAAGRLSPPRRAVALTFDGSLHYHWAVVAPLLRAYGYRGIAFVAPRLLTEGPPRPLSDNLSSSRLDLGQDSGRYLRWSEVESLARAGDLEIQSHTYDHARVFTNDTIVDYQHPDETGAPRYPWLWSAADAAPHDPLWGAPVYASAPRWTARRYFDSAGLRDACQRFVAIRGDRGYLADDTWRPELERFVGRERSRFPDGHYETENETRVAKLASLVRARDALRERLPRPINHVALPGAIDGGAASGLIREAGYITGYTRERPSERLHRGVDPFDLPRLADVWLQSLPGNHRVTLPGHVSAALRRR